MTTPFGMAAVVRQAASGYALRALAHNERLTPLAGTQPPLWVEDDRRGAESSGPLCSGTPSFPIEWLLRDADLPVESVGWPVLAGHLPSLMVGRYPTVLHRDSDLVGADN